MARNVFVTGAGRGIGLSLVKHLLQQGECVWATYRDADKASALLRLAEKNSNLTVEHLDVTDSDQLFVLSQKWKHIPFDWIVNNAGVYGPKSVNFQDIKTSEWLDVLTTNTIAPYQVTRTFYANLLQGKERKLVFISSKMGSIEDNTSGGGYLYRSSKSALNQIAKSLAIDLSYDDVCVLALHPGWVQTAMGGPNALIPSDVSASGLVTVIECADLEASGQFWNFDGSRIEW
ncbi:SDR family oxidoreductase [Marinomonas agarivorans]|nr:SDR family oxidoreductase [Marinomonas agarivorans]